MAKIYPNTDKVRVVFQSNAEEQLYNAFKRFSTDWSIYYSCTLSSIEPDQGLVDNEIDFVLYHPGLGVVVIEVKGGRISYDPSTQHFKSENRYGEKFDIKNPFLQALNWKSRFLRFLKKREIKVPVSHLVCMPTVSENDFLEKSDMEIGLLIGRERLADLEASIKTMIMNAQPQKYLNFRDAGEDIDKILRGASYTSKTFLGDYIKYQEHKVTDVQWMQDTLVLPLAQSRKVAVEGEAGTGKTILASALAKYFRDKGDRVLYLSSSALLNDFLRPALSKGIEVETYAEFASSYGVELLKRPHDFEGTREDWIQYVGPERLKASIAESSRKFDVLVCDEAQDVQPFWWESIEVALKNDKSHFYIFFDRSQGVFGSGSADNSFVPEDVLPIPAPYFPLIHNYRTTKEISSFAQSFRTGRQIIMSHSARLGYVPELIYYNDSKEGRDKMEALLERLCHQEGLSSEDVTILSARRPFQDQSIFEGFKEIGNFTLQELSGKSLRKIIGKKPVSISTIASFKGLETKVAIVCNISEYHLPLSNPLMSSLFYVACTRAKHMLYIFVKLGDSKQQVLEKALEGVNKKGGFVIEEDNRSHTYVGIVSYYNPDRMGWLKIEDEVGIKSNIMFFPSDIQQLGVGKVEVGSKFAFRIKPEGYVSIAVDLKMIVNESKPTK